MRHLQPGDDVSTSQALDSKRKIRALRAGQLRPLAPRRGERAGVRGETEEGRCESRKTRWGQTGKRVLVSSRVTPEPLSSRSAPAPLRDLPRLEAYSGR